MELLKVLAQEGKLVDLVEKVGTHVFKKNELFELCTKMNLNL